MGISARNQLYEHTIPCTVPRPDSCTYEKPVQLQRVKLRSQAFEGNTSENSPNRRPDVLPHKPKKEKIVDIVEAESYSSLSYETERSAHDVYDDPLDIIPTERNEDIGGGAGTFTHDYRPCSHYEKPLPHTPEETYSEFYDYATREEMLAKGTQNHLPAEKPLDTTLEKENPRFKNPNCDDYDHYEDMYGYVSEGVANEVPLYDVLDHANGKK